MMDDNRIFSLMILVMVVGSAYAMSMQRIKTLVGYRSMTLAPIKLKSFNRANG